jgi:hypothetical protein
MRCHISAAPAGRGEFGPWSGGLGHPAVSSGVGRSAVPVGDQRKRISGAISLIVTGLPDNLGRVEAGLLSDVAVVRPGSDQFATVFAGHTGVPPRQGPAAYDNKVVDESRTPYVTGREHEGANNLIPAIPGVVDRVGAGVEQRRVHLVVVQERPVRLRWRLNQPQRDAQCVPACRAPKAFHCGSVALRPDEGIRNRRNTPLSKTPFPLWSGGSTVEKVGTDLPSESSARLTPSICPLSRLRSCASSRALASRLRARWLAAVRIRMAAASVPYRARTSVRSSR